MARLLTPDVRDFVSRYLGSVERLETFVFLRRGATRYWTATEIAEALDFPTEAMEQALERLASDNFLEVKIANDLMYRFDPVETLRETAEQVGVAYSRDRTALLRLAASSTRRAISDLANAFRLKGEDSDG